MARKEITTSWDRDNRNAMNDNFKRLFEERETLQKQINDLIIESGTSDAEVIQARGEYQVLNDRLVAITAQLAQKANRNEIMTQEEFDSWVATLLDGGPSIFYDTLTALQNDYPDGAAGVALVRETDPARVYVWNGEEWADYGEYQGIEVKDNTITTRKLAKKSVTPETTTFVELGKNKFNGIYINGSITGSLDNPTLSFGNGKLAIVRVKQNTRYAISKADDTDRFRVCASVSYPGDGVSLEGLQYIDSQTSTAVQSRNFNFLIVYLSSPSENREPGWFQVEEREEGGNTPYTRPRAVIDLETGSVSVDSLINVPNLGMLVGSARTFDVSLRRKEIVVSTEGAFILAGTNRYNPDGGTFSYSHITDFSSLLVGYDTQDDAIVFMNTGDRDSIIRDNITIVGIIRDDNQETTCHFNGLYLIDGRNPNEGGSSGNPGSDLLIHNEDFVTDVETTVPDRTQVDSSYIFNIFDDLVNDYPDYVTRSILGTGADGSEIPMYEFTPPSLTSNSSNVTQLPKIYVQGGIHGHEWASVLTTARFFNNLCRTWRENKGFAKMKFNVQFIVVPVLNIWGVDNYASGGGGVESRKNFNGVDLNRDYPTGWTYDPDPESMTTTGDEPLSQPETQLVYSYLQNNPDIEFAIDTHNFGIYPDNTSYALWLGGSNSTLRDFNRGVGMHMSAQLQSEYQLNADNESLVRISSPTSGGGVNEWEVMGLISTLLEMPYAINGGGIVDGQVLASNFSQSAMGNLILGMLDKYPYIK